jgi:PilZ domain
MPSEDAQSKRRYARVKTPLGVWVAWQTTSGKGVSRVRDLNVGGLFLVDANTAPLGSMTSVLLSVPEGEIRCEAVVRNVEVGKGMGIEFTKMSEEVRARLEAFVSRLLRTSPSATA